MQQAKKLGEMLVVIVNNDTQATLKKGRPFMKATERAMIIGALRDVDRVVISVDTDRTVCKTLQQMIPRPTHFCNGGDQTNASIPEQNVCQELGIVLIDGLGDKTQSSSWLLANHKNGAAND
jgi:glycerol-3-phosphate cytidylyltransferase-like family protein